MLKKVFLLTAILFPVTSFACSDLSEYKVENLNFNSLSVQESISAVLKGTPFHVSYDVKPPAGGLVDAKEISGTLDRVLDSLLEKVGLVGIRDGCEIVIHSRKKLIFNLSPGDLIHERLGAWVKAFGYTLYWEAPKYRANGRLTIKKPLDDTLAEIVSLMKSNGAKIEARIYANRAIRVTEVK